MGSLWERACQVFPGGVNSPVRSFKHIGMPPIYFDGAEGPFLESSGRRYIDFCMGFGPHILGHCPELVREELVRQLGRGTSFGACHAPEVALGEEILKSYPGGKVRLLNSGTEAVMTALRVARAATGKEKILKFEGCYHGHFDGLLVSAGSGVADLPKATSKGVPAVFAHSTLVARLDRPDTIEEVFVSYGSDIGAVIVEPIPANEGLFIPPRRLLERLVSLARLHGAVVIFDEVITGFRLGLTGASGMWDLKPDLVTLGKVIGGGLPLSAVVGLDTLMDELAPRGEVYQAGTFSGNVLSVTAGLSTLKYLRSANPFEGLQRRTSHFCSKLQAILSAYVTCEVKHIGSIFWFRFGEDDHFPPVISSEDRTRFAHFYRACLEQGIYFPPSPYEVSFVSVAHSDAVLSEALAKLTLAARSLE